MRARHRHFSYKAAGAVLAYDSRYLTDSDGTALQTWPDRSGAYNATEATAAKRPLVRTWANGINGSTALRFDGIDDSLQAVNVPLNVYITVVVCGSGFASAKQFFIEHSPNAGPNSGFYFYGDQVGAWNFTRIPVSSIYGGNVANWFGQVAAIGSLRNSGTAAYRKNGGSNLSNGGGSGAMPPNTSVTSALNICSRNRTAAFSDGLLGTLQIYNGSASDSMLRRLEHASAFSFKITCS
jgi:hypothetical protein